MTVLAPPRELGECGIKNVRRERYHKAGTLGEANELLGAHLAATRVTPPHQRLYAHQLLRVEIELRLVDDVELLGVDRGAEIREQLEPLDGVDIELGCVEADAVALELRVIERDVDVLQQSFWVVAVHGS